MFNLDLTTSKPETKDKSDTEDKWRSVKIIVGSAIGCITALLFFILAIVYSRRRYKRLEQEINDEVASLR